MKQKQIGQISNSSPVTPASTEQNATLVTNPDIRDPVTANTVGPGLFFQSDRMIGGCDGVLGRGMQWQGLPCG